MFFLMPKKEKKRKNNVYFTSGPLRNRIKYGIRCPRDLLGKTPMKELCGGNQRGLEQSSHSEVGVTTME